MSRDDTSPAGPEERADLVSEESTERTAEQVPEPSADQLPGWVAEPSVRRDDGADVAAAADASVPDAVSGTASVAARDGRPSAGVDGAGDAVLAWAESLDSGAENDTMLRFTPSRQNAVDLTDANSSGLMQLFAGRRTRLSTLLNEASAFAAGREAAAAIRAKVREMSEERGIDVGHLAAGIAGWTEETAAGVEQFTAPVMLVPISLRPRPDGDDFEVQFTAPARLNPALARHLADRHGLALDPAEFEAAGYATARFDPSRTSELLGRLASRRAAEESEDAGGALSSLQVWRQVYLSTFADVSGLDRPAGLDSSHPVLRALASSEPLSQPEADAEAQAAPNLDDRDPQDERLVVDADADQQAVLDAVAAGQSMVVSAPPGTGQTQTAVNAVAALSWAGRRTLVVSERAAALEEFTRRLSRARLGTLALQVPASTTTEDLRQQLIRAIKRVERSEPPRLTGLQSRLRERRHELVDHVDSLHQVRRRWSCSPYQAMQALAALTSLNPAPSTSVRLKRSVLDTTVDRSQVTVKLKRAAELGAFSAETRSSPWYNARPRNRQETDDAAALVARLREELPRLKGHMETAAAVTGLRQGTSFSDWHAQVLLFQRVQESLGKFTHDVYTKPVDDLIAATAPGWWRKQHGVEMTSIARSRLRRVAKEYIRPGVSIHDLHSSLVEVQAEREEWAEYAVDEVRLKVPKNLDRLADAVGTVQRHLEKLVDVLDPDVAERQLRGVPGGAGEVAGDGDGSGESGRRTLLDIPFARMVDIVEALAEDQEPLETLPERTLVTEQLREQGFRELMEDLAEREVPAERVADELELAWWQSTLEAMISGDDYLAMTSGENLRRIEEEFRAADAAHIEAGARRLDHSLSVRWKSAVEAHPEAAARLKELLRDGSPTVAALDEVADELIQPLVPVWTSSPLGLVEQFPEGLRADAVILLDAESLAAPSALGAISRGAQVISFGDPATGAPKPLQISADPMAPAVGREVPESIHEQLARVLPVRRLRRVHRGVDQELTELLSEEVYDGELMRLPDASQLTGQGRRLTVESLAESSAAPSAGDVADSPTREVNRVVDMVFEHIRSRRDASLAVITGSERHARRVADALKVNLANHSWARGFFEADGRERFVVAPVERAHHLVRDHVIFSLGFGRGVSGDPVRDFGALSGPRGREYAAVAATRAREQLRLVTSLTPEQIDGGTLDPGAALVMRLVDRGLREGGNPTASATLTDPLVLDLVDRIRARGGRVEDGFHGTLDLAACPRKISPQVPVTPVAMVSDGTDGYAATSVRERSRQNPEQFEQLGWTHVVLWTIEVFTDPARCTEMVAEKVGLAAGPEFAEHGRIALKTTGALADREPEQAVGARVRFGGAADVDDEDSQRRAKSWPAPRQRGSWYT